MSTPHDRLARRPLPFLAMACATLVLSGCGGGGSSATAPAAPTSPTTDPVQATPLPFWASDAPVRPSLAHLFPTVAAEGAALSLGADDAARVRAAAAPGERAPAAPLAVAVQRRTVTGLFADVYHTTDGAASLPFDLSASTVEALAPDGLGGFERIAATSRRSDGTYVIDAVPDGGYWARINSTYVWTSAAIVDWGSDFFGRIDTAYAGNRTLLTLNAGNLAAWQAGDVLAWSVPMQGASLALPLSTASWIRNPPATGDTALGDFSLDFGIDPVDAIANLGLLSATRGDQAYLNQLSGRAGTGYRTLSRSLVLPALNQVDGTPTTLATGFIDIAQTGSLKLKFDRRAFADHLGEAGPGAVATSSVLGLSTSALPPRYGVPGGAFSLMEFNTFGSTAIDFGRVRYGNPFPADWAQIVESYYGFTVRYLAPGATVALPVERFLYGVDLVPTDSADPTLQVRPRMTPVLAPKVNGKTLFSNQVAVGATPRLDWSAPATGQPDRYLVTIRRLHAVGARSAANTVGRFYTAQPAMTVPPGVLQPGEVYFLTISAISAGRPSNEPARSQLPYAFATMMSALISP